MSWKDRCLSFVKKYGKAAKVVAGGVLNVVAPGSGTLLSLVDLACDKATETAQDHWEAALLQATHDNAAELQRLGQLFELLNGDLAKLCDKAFAFADQPDDLPDIIGRALAADPALQQVTRRLETLTAQFAAVQDDLRGIKKKQADHQVILEEIRAEVRQANDRKRRGVSFATAQEEEFLRKALERFRQLPPELQKAADRADLADCADEIGLFDLAREEHLQAAQAAEREHNHSLAAAEHYKAYRAACEKKQWPAALASLRRAVDLQAALAPFDWEQYEVLEILGAGGFGTVFRCRDRHLDEEVAIKAIHTGELARGVLEVFKEAAILKKLSHKAIIAVTAARFADAARQRPYIVMEYFASRSLAARLEEGLLPVAEFLRVVRPLAEALQAAHAGRLDGLPFPVYHRDVKPDNVLLGEAGQVKVIDFGLAVRVAAALKSTSTAPERRTQKDLSYAGTLEFSPPEQRGELHKPVGPYSDIYAFGRTCCKLLFGFPTLSRHSNPKTQPEPRHWNRKKDPLPQPLVDLLERCAQQAVEDRPQDFQEILDVLDMLEHPTPPPPPPTPIVRFVCNCGRKLKAPLAEAGRKAKCTGCGQSVVIPTQDTDQPPLFTNQLGMQFAWVPPGDSWLGGGDGKPGTTKFTLPHGLWCGVYPVTQAEWQAVMNTTPSHFKGNPRYPVESVSWNDAQKFIEQLNQRTRADGLLYRLPTEEEWEYLCRGGPLSQQQSKYHFYFARSKADLTSNPSDNLSSNQANFDSNHPAGTAAIGPYLQRTCDVGLYLPNPLGIYDLHGNVWEWTSSVYARGSARVIRGGGWFDYGSSCTASHRLWSVPDVSDYDVGFRLLAVPSGNQ